MKTASTKILLSVGLLATTIAAGATLANTDLINKADRPDRDAVKAAIESGNYEEFVSLTKESKISENITIDNFGQLQELQTARENGDTETAKAIADELGLKKGKGRHGKGGKGKKNPEMKAIFESLTDEQKEELKALKEDGQKDQFIPTLQSWGVEIPAEVLEKQAERAAVKSAIESGNYAEFAALTADKPYSENITAENFAQLQELHAAKEAGDTETAKTIAAELGLEKKGGRKGGKGKNRSERTQD